MKTKTIWITAGSIAAAIVIGGVGVAAADRFDPFDDDRLTGSALDQASTAALAQVGDGRVTDAEFSDDLDHRYEIEVTRENNQQVDVFLDQSFTVVGLSTDNDKFGTVPSGTAAPSRAAGTFPGSEGQPISDSERASATAAALAHSGGGQITALERSDDRTHAWEVEVTLDNGVDIDIELDEGFVVIRVDNS